MKENSKITEDDIKEKIRKKNMIGDYLTYPIMAVNFLKSDKKIKPLYYKYNNNKAQYILKIFKFVNFLIYGIIKIWIFS